MKNILCFLLVLGVTFLQVTSAARQKEAESGKISEAQLKTMITKSISFEEPDLTPLDDPDFNIDNENDDNDGQSSVVNTPTSRIITSNRNGIYKSTIINKRARKIVKSISDNAHAINKSVIKDGNKLVQSIDDGRNRISKNFVKDDENGKIVKTITDEMNGLTTSILKTRETLVHTIDDKKNGLTKSFIRQKDGKIIKTIKDDRAGVTKSNILDKDGQWIEAVGDGSKTMIMGLDNYQNGISQSTLKNTIINQWRINSAANINGNFAGNYVHVARYSWEHKGYIPVFIFLNKGIVNNSHLMMINGYHECSRTSRNFPKDAFEDISDFGAKVNDPKNIGYLVHYTRDGKGWRTKDEHIIENVLKGDETIFDDCGYTEYHSADNTISWIKNEGIIENDIFVTKSSKLSDLGTVYKYVDGKNEFMWTKPNNSHTTVSSIGKSGSGRRSRSRRQPRTKRSLSSKKLESNTPEGSPWPVMGSEAA